MPKIRYTRFPITSPYSRRRGSCQLVAKLLATSRCSGIWETTRHSRHNGLLPAPTCQGLATGKLVWWILALTRLTTYRKMLHEVQKNVDLVVWTFSWIFLEELSHTISHDQRLQPTTTARYMHSAQNYLISFRPNDKNAADRHTSNAIIDAAFVGQRTDRNKYKCTIDQELADAVAYAPADASMFTRQVAALFSVKWRHGCHLQSVTSNRKSDSVNRWVFTWRTLLSNFIPIQFKTTEP